MSPRFTPAYSASSRVVTMSYPRPPNKSIAASMRAERAFLACATSLHRWIEAAENVDGHRREECRCCDEREHAAEPDRRPEHQRAGERTDDRTKAADTQRPSDTGRAVFR